MDLNSGSPENDSPSSTSGSFLLIGAGIAVFIVCSIVQAAGGTTMFTTSFEDPDNIILELFMQLTWWPGWIVTVLLIGAGVRTLFGRDSRPPGSRQSVPAPDIQEAVERQGMAHPAIAFFADELVTAAGPSPLGRDQTLDQTTLLTPLGSQARLRNERVQRRCSTLVRHAMDNAAEDCGWVEVNAVRMPRTWAPHYKDLLSSAEDVPAIIAFIRGDTDLFPGPADDEPIARKQPDHNHPQIGYDASDWTDREREAIIDALGRIGVNWFLDGEDLVIDREHEAVVDALLLGVTGGEWMDSAPDVEVQRAAHVGLAPPEPTPPPRSERPPSLHRPPPPLDTVVVPAGMWALDPFGRHRVRYHDGTEWTATVADDAATTADPPEHPAPAGADHSGVWATDPFGRRRQRFHDGGRWTSYVADVAGVRSIDDPTYPAPAKPVAAEPGESFDDLDVVYSTTGWSPPVIAEIVLRLAAAWIGYEIIGGELFVAKRDESAADDIVADCTGDTVDLVESATEVCYSTTELADYTVAEILASLSDAGITHGVEDDEIVVDKLDEERADAIIDEIQRTGAIPPPPPPPPHPR